MRNLKSIFLGVALFGIIALVSCKKNDPLTENDQINNWIYANMDFWYLWTDQLPKKSGTNQDPEDFYESLLSPEDRFSFIYDDFQELISLLNGISLESGFEFKLYLEEEGSSNVILQITYIKADSPAEELELKRGDIISKINGIQLTESNFSDLLGDMNESYVATYRRYNFDDEIFEEQGTVNITPIVYSENPALLDTVYELGGKKIGYLVYTFFSPGPTGNSTAYDDFVDDVFADFKSKNIDELILDLRFNSGGSETSIVNLASQIVKGADSDDRLFVKTYNDEVTQAVIDEIGIDFLTVNFSDETSNIGDQLSSSTVYVLTSSRTASASEVVINSLKPYMSVYLVGETTVGKDVGSVTLFDDEDPTNNWALQPIVVKLVNNDGEDYPDGFAPNVELKDNFLILKALGDIEEPLLSTALGAIGVLTARVDDSFEMMRQPILNSATQKAWNERIILSKPVLEEIDQ